MILVRVSEGSPYRESTEIVGENLKRLRKVYPKQVTVVKSRKEQWLLSESKKMLIYLS